MKTDPGVVDEESEQEIAQDRNHGDASDQAPRLALIVAPSLPCLAQRRQQEQEQRRRHQQELDRDPGSAIGMERPWIPLPYLEAKSGAVVAEIPHQQRQPSQRARHQRHPYPDIAQEQAPASIAEQSRQARDDHQQESIVRQCANHQRSSEQDQATRGDAFAQAGDQVQAEQGRHHQGHIR